MNAFQYDGDKLKRQFGTQDAAEIARRLRADHSGFQIVALLASWPLALAYGSAYVDKTTVAGKTYRYRVTAKINGGQALQSDEMSVRAGTADPPLTPINVITSSADHAIGVRWERASGEKPLVVGAQVYRATARDGPWLKLASVVAEKSSGPKPLYVDDTVENDQPYYYRVTSLDPTGGESAPSLAASTVPHDAKGPPPPPQVAVGTIDDDTHVRIAWVGVDLTRVVAYNVYRGPSSSGPFELLTPDHLPARSIGFVDAHPRLGEPEGYFVTALDGRGLESAKSTGAYVRVRDPRAPAPFAVAVTPAQESLTLSWPVAGDGAKAVAWDVLRSNAETSGFARVASVAYHGGASVSYVDSSTIFPGVEYYYQVVPTTLDGIKGSAGAAVHGRILQKVAVAPVSGVGARKAVDGVAISWTPATLQVVTGYDVYRQVTGSAQGQIKIGSVAAGSTQFVDKQAPPGVKLSYVVVATGATGILSAPSEAADIDVPARALPPVPGSSQ